MTHTPAPTGNSPHNRDHKRRPNRYQQRPKPEFDERVVEIARVTRVVKGGRRMRFRALVVIGDKKGKVGVAMAKAGEVPTAIGKAVEAAKKRMVMVKITEDGSIAHELKGTHGASSVILLPAKEGSSLVAGGSARAVLELAGYRNIVAKSLGSNNKVNVILATINALGSIQSEKSTT